MKLEIVTNDANETIEFGKSIARALEARAVLRLVGDLGAGKTTLVKGIAMGLGFRENVTSPTFTLLNEYLGEEKSLFHFDFYRIEDPSELEELGFEGYFPAPDGITVVEWAERALWILPKEFYQITIHKVDDEKRKIVFEKVAR